MTRTPPAQFQKDPEASRIFGIDWSAQLGEGVTVSSVAWEVPAGLAKDDEDQDGALGLVQLSGGEAGTTYTVVGTATFSNTEVDVRRFKIYCQLI
jgi:hypothetical protein